MSTSVVTLKDKPDVELFVLKSSKESSSLTLLEMVTMLSQGFPYDNDIAEDLIYSGIREKLIRNFFDGKCSRLVFSLPFDKLKYVKAEVKEGEDALKRSDEFKRESRFGKVDSIYSTLPPTSSENLKKKYENISPIDDSDISPQTEPALSAVPARIKSSTMFKKNRRSTYSESKLALLTREEMKYELSTDGVEIQTSNFYPESDVGLVVYFENIAMMPINSIKDFHKHVFSGYSMFDFDAYALCYDIMNTYFFPMYNFDNYSDLRRIDQIQQATYLQKYLMRSSSFMEFPFLASTFRNYTDKLPLRLTDAYNLFENFMEWYFTLQLSDFSLSENISKDDHGFGLNSDFKQWASAFGKIEYIIRKISSESRTNAFIYLSNMWSNEFAAFVQSLQYIKQITQNAHEIFQTLKRLSQSYKISCVHNRMLVYEIPVAALFSIKLISEHYSNVENWSILVRSVCHDMVDALVSRINSDFIINLCHFGELQRLIMGFEHYKRFECLLITLMKKYLSTAEYDSVMIEVRKVSEVPVKRVAQIFYILCVKILYKNLDDSLQYPNDWIQIQIRQTIPKFVAALHILDKLPPFEHSLSRYYSKEWDETFESFLYEMGKIQNFLLNKVYKLLRSDGSLSEILELVNFLSCTMPFNFTHNMLLHECKNMQIEAENVLKNLELYLRAAHEKKFKHSAEFFLNVREYNEIEELTTRKLQKIKDIMSQRTEIIRSDSIAQSASDYVQQNTKIWENAHGRKILYNALKEWTAILCRKKVFRVISTTPIFKLGITTFGEIEIPEIDEETFYPDIYQNEDGRDFNKMSRVHIFYKRQLALYKYILTRFNRLELQNSEIILKPIVREILHLIAKNEICSNAQQSKWLSLNHREYDAELYHILNKTENNIYTLVHMHQMIVQRLRLISMMRIIFIAPIEGQILNEEFVKKLQNEQKQKISYIFDVYQDSSKCLRYMNKRIKSHYQELDVISKQWKNYVEFLDRLLYECIQLCLKKSLLLIYKLFHPNYANGKYIYFKISTQAKLNLGSKGVKNLKVTFNPSLELVIMRIRSICCQFPLRIYSGIYSFTDIFFRKLERRDIMKECINSVEIRAIQMHIVQLTKDYALRVKNAFDAIVGKDFSILLESINEQQINLSDLSDQNLAKVDEHLNSHLNVISSISNIPPSVKIGCILFDCAELKQSLIKRCEIGAKYYEEAGAYLIEIVSDKIEKFINSSASTLYHCPASYDQVKLFDKILESLNNQSNSVQQLMDRVDKFLAILRKHKKKISKKPLRRYDRLMELWTEHLKRLESSAEQSDFVKTKFRYQLEVEMDSWLDSIQFYWQTFMNECPEHPSIENQKAMSDISDWLELASDVASIKELFIKALDDLDVKKQLSNVDELFVEDVSSMLDLWKRKEEYDNQRIEWDKQLFKDLNMNDIEDFVSYRCVQMKNEYEEFDKAFVKRPLFKYLYDVLNDLNKLLPLLSKLNNKDLRLRHWQTIAQTTNKQINDQLLEMVLSSVLKLPIAEFAYLIAEVGETASKENDIEKILTNLENEWKYSLFDVVKLNEQAKKIKNTDTIIELAVNTQTQISALKGSKYASYFEERILKWHNVSKGVLDLCELLSTVQRRYLYMEGLFRSPDVRQQIPQESKQFAIINQNWIIILNILKKNKHIFDLIQKPILRDELSKLLEQLDNVQCKLEAYLETKRVTFPRFYFISDDTLVHILSLSSEPLEVIVHLESLFDNISSLKVNNAAMAEAICSSENEVVNLTKSVSLAGNVERWLSNLENAMTSTVKELMKATIDHIPNKKSDYLIWLEKWPGQCLVTASEILWTSLVTNVISNPGVSYNIRKLSEEHNKLLQEYSRIMREEQLTVLLRQKIIAVITKEVHGRDVIGRLEKNGVQDANSFEWISQLRQYWEQFDKKGDHCTIKQLNSLFRHCYEYLGCSSRLVITPLTERCYMTMTAALSLCCGGSPKGPAGTGKTETVKDLGKTLGAYVVVINCSEGLNYKQIGKTLSGIAQSGAWGCFDEFNRINVEVLSVVAQQVQTIFDALKKGCDTFLFESEHVALVKSAAIFITMNPGYAGRTELPDNLKTLFRPIAMVVPDNIYIAEISLFSEGFKDTKNLASKICAFYRLADQQLSKQPHYDFGLRSMTSLLRYAGIRRKKLHQYTDEQILELSMRDVNAPKLARNDLLLFNLMCSDIFPNVSSIQFTNEKLVQSIKDYCASSNIELTESLFKKVLQLADTKLTRHSIMLVGNTMTGKTTCWNVLCAAINSLSKSNAEYLHVEVHKVNTKALNESEMYGALNLNTGEWSDGVVSNIMRKVCQGKSSSSSLNQSWVLFDGPVDAGWIENMNSLMDDNKILTLANGERITMPSDKVCLLFETENLKVASPATVSRCGIIYFDEKDLDWSSLMQRWLSTLKENDQNMLRTLFSSIFQKILFYKSAQKQELLHVESIQAFLSFKYLFEQFFKRTKVNVKANRYFDVVRMIFTYCTLWSLCGSMNESGRKGVDQILRDMDNSFPSKDTVFEYYVDEVSWSWKHWEEKLIVQEPTKQITGAQFIQMIVPTVDTIRTHSILTRFIEANRPVLIVGYVGTGKSYACRNILNSQDNSAKYNSLTIYMSARTSSKNVQENIEAEMEKEGKNTLCPKEGKSLTIFIDDINMPQADKYGSQPTLEIIRELLNEGAWYNRSTLSLTKIKNVSIMAAMSVSMDAFETRLIPNRLKSKFATCALITPSDRELHRIYETLLAPRLQHVTDDIYKLFQRMIDATIDLYRRFEKEFLPTPSKLHYVCNLRDLGKVCEGLSKFDMEIHANELTCIKLWLFECYRTFHDKLIDPNDQAGFLQISAAVVSTNFGLSFSTLTSNNKLPLFTDLLNNKSYDMIESNNTFALKQKLEDALAERNKTMSSTKLNVVLFDDAVEHVIRIVRVLRRPRGNLLLIGIGGSGRRSLSKLASFVCQYQVFEIQVSNMYGITEFREDIKKMYKIAGINNRELVFLFNDSQILHLEFLEDIGNILNGGAVPNLFKPEDIEDIRSTLERVAKRENISTTTSSLIDFLIARVRSNLHIILCMNPFEKKFRDYVRMFPSILNCTTIDYIGTWPHAALVEVAHTNFLNYDLSPHNERFKLMKELIADIHSKVDEYCAKMMQHTRTVYATPSNFLQFMQTIKLLIEKRRVDTLNHVGRLKDAIDKINETKKVLTEAQLNLDEKKKVISAYQTSCEQFLVTLEEQKHEAAQKQQNVTVQSSKLQDEQEVCKEIALHAEEELSEAMPMLNAAMEALNALSKKDIDEIGSYAHPPRAVEQVMSAVMVLKGKQPTWEESRRDLGDINFVKSLVNFDKDHIPEKILKRITQIVKTPSFSPEIVGKTSIAAKSMCSWVIAIEAYARVFKIVKPKIDRYEKAKKTLITKQSDLESAISSLEQIKKQIEQLEIDYARKMEEKNELQKSAEETAMFLETAEKMIGGTADKSAQWEIALEEISNDFEYITVKSIVDAACLTYMGPFTPSYRDLLFQEFDSLLKRKQLSLGNNRNWLTNLSTGVELDSWALNGLPRDAFSAQNATICMKSDRFVYLIDPQSQAVKWLKRFYKSTNFETLDVRDDDLLSKIEDCMKTGTICLVQNANAEPPSILDAIFMKDLNTTDDGKRVICIGANKHLPYNENFRLFLATKLSNPSLSSEVFSKLTVVNFAVKQDGLKEQLLEVFVRLERPDLAEQKITCTRTVAAMKAEKQALEDEFLSLIQEAEGSLLENPKVLLALEKSNSAAVEIMNVLKASEQAELLIDESRSAYAKLASKAADLFFVLEDFEAIHSMYQFSLDAYVQLLEQSVEQSVQTDHKNDRLRSIEDTLTRNFHIFASNSLFQEHRLLLSFHICIKLLKSSNMIDKDEYNFFIRGSNFQVDTRLEAMPNNLFKAWLPERLWAQLCLLVRLRRYRTIAATFNSFGDIWKKWFNDSHPEQLPTPGGVEATAGNLCRLQLIKILRPDRLSYMLKHFIECSMGENFDNSQTYTAMSIYKQSSYSVPVLFILSPGADPSQLLNNLANELGKTNVFSSLSLGQGQTEKATLMLTQAARKGGWVYLANCHLSESWLPYMDRFIEELQLSGSCDSNFRLFLSCAPFENFPINTLQTAIKITTEPPTGIKQNMIRLIKETLSRDEMYHIENSFELRRLLYPLSYFHALILERQKFGKIGWNNVYHFNDSDYSICVRLIAELLHIYSTQIPWQALKHMIASVMYGGHVTDDWDMRLLRTYTSDMFNESIFVEQKANKPGSKSTAMYHIIPTDGPISHYLSHIETFPTFDEPALFGLHANSQIAARLLESKVILSQLISLRPFETEVEGKDSSTAATTKLISKDQQVQAIIVELLRLVPQPIAAAAAADDDSYFVVLKHEIDRYNELLSEVRRNLLDLQNAIKGKILMSFQLEKVMDEIYSGKVPLAWQKFYQSAKSLTCWMNDLIERVRQIDEWAKKGQIPQPLWLSGISLPGGLLTAIQQVHARQFKLPIDTLSWQFDFSNKSKHQTGLVLSGFHLEGAGWDKRTNTLIDCGNKSEIYVPLPDIRFIPVNKTNETSSNLYKCPCYYTTQRSNETFVVSIDVPYDKKLNIEHFVRRGAAILLNLDD